MRHVKRTRWLAVLGLWGFTTLSGCNCRKSNIHRASGEPTFVAPKGDLHVTIDTAGKQMVIDFGPTLINQDQPNTKQVQITNDGVAAVSILKLTKDPGFDSDAFKVPTANQIQQTIQPGATGGFTVAFAPSAAQDYASSFALVTDADETSGQPLKITLKGQGVANGCLLAPANRLDFGNVRNGSSYTKTLVVQNTTPIDWTFTFQGITGPDAALFTTSLSVGDLTLHAHDQLSIPVVYTANHPGGASAELQFQSPTDMCAPEPFDLRGNGVDSLIVASPSPVDFGFVDPGVAWGSVKQAVTLTNQGNDDITLSGGQFCDGTWTGATVPCNATSEFANAAGGSQEAVSGLTIAAGQSVSLDLYFKPARLHTAQAHMQLTTNNLSQTAFGFDMTGVGGGPKISVQPPVVDFGVVGVGAPQSRTVVVTNVGSSVSGQTDSYLKILSVDVQPGAGTQPGEFSVSFDPTDHGKAWLSATQRANLPVKLDPAGAGNRSATLTITSNDPVTPTTTVQIQADAQQLPPCTYTVTPPSLSFGNVQAGRNRIMTFRITNTNAANSCLISDLALGANTTNPPFSLVDGPIASQTLAGGQSLDVQVKFAPTQQASSYTGTVELYTSSAAQPFDSVSLNGSSSPACVLITPDDLDFGVVQQGCASRERTFTVYDVCNSDVTVTSIGLLADPSGLCPDRGSGHTCPYRITSAPTFPATIPTGGSVAFNVKYQPAAVETDVDAIAVQTQDTTQYVVTLTGRGDTTAVQSDVYRQDAQPKVDVLLVVDDSGSMSDKQQALAQNFQSFIQFATSQQVDYHIGVTTTTTAADSASNCQVGHFTQSIGPCGMLAPSDGSRPRVLTNSTPNLEQVFGQNVNVGTSGSGTEMGFEGAYEALSAPNITGWNAGFLRDEASLAVIAVSDASDQSPNTFDFYKNFFLNIKGFRRANAFTFSAISSTQATPPPTSWSCGYDGTNVMPNPYGMMAQATNGVFQEICTDDWASSLRRLGQSAFGYRTRFFLSETPDTNYAITVSIDGTPYPAVNSHGASQWSYTASANAIDFQPLAVPEPGSTLSISYHVLCYPTSP